MKDVKRSHVCIPKSFIDTANHMDSGPQKVEVFNFLPIVPYLPPPATGTEGEPSRESFCKGTVIIIKQSNGPQVVAPIETLVRPIQNFPPQTPDLMALIRT